MNGIIFKEFTISVLYGVGTFALINMELKRKSQPDADE